MIFPKYDSYKDSGVDWLGEIPSHWKLQKAKYLWREVEERSVSGDEQLLSVSQYSGIIPRDEDSRSESLIDYKRCEPNDLVVNIMLAWMGGLGVSEYTGIVSPAYCVYRQLHNHNSKYLGYLYRLSIYLAEFARRSKGVVPSRWRIYTEDFGQVLTLLPPTEEQERIVEFLDCTTAEIDEAIAKKQRLIELLQEQKAILINQAVTKGLNPKAPMRDSGVEWIGEIPEHWEVRRAKYIFKEVDERSKTGTEELLSVSHITGVTPRSEKNVNMFMAEDYSGSKLCQKDDIVINIMWAWMGALGVSTITGIVSPSYGVFRQLKAGILNSWYLEHLLRSTEYVAEYNRRSTGLHSSRLRLYAHMFLSMEITLPPKEEQDKIEIVTNDRVADIDKAINAIEREIISLEELRSIIISQAVTGKIKV
ncbi:hypothetical protein [Nostoc sp. CCY0012]|uniref:restriction endonuclease subunit S n=1 Tax=Nostoc sp. CCY0012 TaxID=1056123 RepID=UPI0039C71A32